MSLLTVKEVAEKLRASERFVLDEIKRKNLRATNPGGRRLGWRIDEADLDTYVNAKANVSKVRRSA